MSDLSTNSTETSSPITTNIKAPPAPDPQAKIENDPDVTNNHPSFLKRLGIPTSLQQARAFGLRHYFIKILSIILLAHGLISLHENIVDIFIVFPQLPSIYKALNFSQEIYSSILYKSLIITATSIIETMFGLSLVGRHSNTIKNLHIVTGFFLFILSYYLLEAVAPINLNHLENYNLAFTLHFCLFS